MLWIRDFTYEHTTLIGGNWLGKGCLQNGGISRGVGAHTDEVWEQMQDSFEGRFSCNPNCVKHRAVRNNYHIGAGDITKCEDPKGECAAGLQHFSTKPRKQSDHLDVQNQNTNKKETWHASVAGVHDGSAFRRSSLCGNPPVA